MAAQHSETQGAPWARCCSSVLRPQNHPVSRVLWGHPCRATWAKTAGGMPACLLVTLQTWLLPVPLHGHWDPQAWPSAPKCCWILPSTQGLPLLRPACYSTTSASSFCLDPNPELHLLPKFPQLPLLWVTHSIPSTAVP